MAPIVALGHAAWEQIGEAYGWTLWRRLLLLSGISAAIPNPIWFCFVKNGFASFCSPAAIAVATKPGCLSFPCLASFAPRILLICCLLITAVLGFPPRRSTSSCPAFFFFLFFYSSSFFLFLSFNLSTTAPPAALSSSIPPSHPPSSSSPTSALSKLSLLCGGHAGDRSPSAPAAPPLKVTSPSRLCRRFVGSGALISGIRPTHPPLPLLSHPALPLLCLFFRVCVCV